MTIILEREFERQGGLRAHGQPLDSRGRPTLRIRSGGSVILHRLSEDILTSNVFGVLEKLEPQIWLKPLLAECFSPSDFPSLFSDANYDLNKMQFLYWHELEKPVRPPGHEEGPTQVDLFVVMPKATISFEVKFGAGLAGSIATDLPDPSRKRPGVKERYRWDQVIRNIERGYVHTQTNYPGRGFFFIVLAMERESARTSYFGRYKDHPENIREQIESGYRWRTPREARRHFNDDVYRALSRQMAWLTWGEVEETLARIRFPDITQELFRKEMVRYIDSKRKLFAETRRQPND